MLLYMKVIGKEYSMKKMMQYVVIVFMLVFVAQSDASETVKIGVLAKDGAAKCLSKWNATADYLNTKITNKKFEIIPLDFEQVNPTIEKGEVQFFLVNSSMFVTTSVKYGAVAIATIINSRQGKSLTSFGGVIFTRVDNSDINTLKDLKGKSFMAVKNTSFGGWQMAYKELLDAGIDPLKDFTSLEFGKQHDNVVLAVLNMAVDAGTVRTDTLERMVAAGDIDIEDFKIINQKKYDNFPFLCSTKLYAEWPLAKTASTPDVLAKKVLVALKEMTADDQAAQKAKIVGWVDALDYKPIDVLQKKLKADIPKAEQQ